MCLRAFRSKHSYDTVIHTTWGSKTIHFKNIYGADMNFVAEKKCERKSGDGVEIIRSEEKTTTKKLTGTIPIQSRTHAKMLWKREHNAVTMRSFIRNAFGVSCESERVWIIRLSFYIRLQAGSEKEWKGERRIFNKEKKIAFITRNMPEEYKVKVRDARFYAVVVRFFFSFWSLVCRNNIAEPALETTASSFLGVRAILKVFEIPTVCTSKSF